MAVLNNTRPHKILLADDHGFVREALEQLLTVNHGDKVITTEDLDGTLRALALDAEPYDLVLLDVMMPGMNGLEGLQKVLGKVSDQTAVALITGAANPDMMRKARELGANGVISKTLGSMAVLREVRSILHGIPSFMPVLRNGTGEVAGLTRRECEVLGYLYRGMPNREIASALGLKEVTVKLHMRNICQKLDASNRTQAVLRGQELGIFPPI